MKVTGGGGGSGGSGGSGGGSRLTAASLLATLRSDPAVYRQLLHDVGGCLAGDSGFSTALVTAMASVARTYQAQGPGRLLVGTVAGITGGKSSVMVAAVKINAANTATACYVPAHLEHDLAVGQDVFVEPVNGAMSDLMVVAIRNFASTPGGTYLLAAPATVSTANPGANATVTVTAAGAFGVPSNAAAVLLYATLTASAIATLYFGPGSATPGSGSHWAALAALVANQATSGQVVVPLSGGKFSYLATVVPSAFGLYVVGYIV